MSAINVILRAFAAERRAVAPLLLSASRAAIDRSMCQASAQQQTHSSGVRRANDGINGQTDGRPAVTWTLLRILCEQCKIWDKADGR